MAVLKVILLLLVGGAGMWYASRHLRRNWLEIKGRASAPKAAKGSSDPLAAHRAGAAATRPSAGDLVFNHGLSFLWFGYLFAFFAGLIVNNLFLK